MKVGEFRRLLLVYKYIEVPVLCLCEALNVYFTMPRLLVKPKTLRRRLVRRIPVSQWPLIGDNATFFFLGKNAIIVYSNIGARKLIVEYVTALLSVAARLSGNRSRWATSGPGSTVPSLCLSPGPPSLVPPPV